MELIDGHYVVKRHLSIYFAMPTVHFECTRVLNILYYAKNQMICVNSKNIMPKACRMFENMYLQMNKYTEFMEIKS